MRVEWQSGHGTVTEPFGPPAVAPPFISSACCSLSFLLSSISIDLLSFQYTNHSLILHVSTEPRHLSQPCNFNLLLGQSRSLPAEAVFPGKYTKRRNVPPAAGSVNVILPVLRWIGRRIISSASGFPAPQDMRRQNSNDHRCSMHRTHPQWCNRSVFRCQNSGHWRIRHPSYNCR